MRTNLADDTYIARFIAVQDSYWKDKQITEYINTVSMAEYIKILSMPENERHAEVSKCASVRSIVGRVSGRVENRP